MASEQSNWIDRHVSKQFANPFRLALDLLREPNPAARSALWMAAAGLLLTPLDMLLAPFERRTLARSPRPAGPVILVAGPPRSGTTLVAQTIINELDVAYPNNVTALFPRAPVVANRLLRGFVRPRRGSYDAYYGKSTGLAGANDALPVWDRWLGADRSGVPAALMEGSAEHLPRYFGALQALYGRPAVNKVNRLNTCAHLVAAVLPEAQFVFLQRDPVQLAQSLYVAREKIVGDRSRAYGVQHPDRCADDPVEDVCRQVLFHEEQLRRQVELLPPGRGWVISYEDFCRRPHALLARLRASFAAIGVRPGASAAPPPFEVARRRQLPAELYARLERRLAELGAGRIACDNLQAWDAARPSERQPTP